MQSPTLARAAALTGGLAVKVLTVERGAKSRVARGKRGEVCLFGFGAGTCFNCFSHFFKASGLSGNSRFAGHRCEKQCKCYPRTHCAHVTTNVRVLPHRAE